ncbi:MAG: hypothetical protein JNM64_14825, partial [Chloroflexia bacterium]|nr:hypothetical protein [Chloroflexia bacterium]
GATARSIGGIGLLAVDESDARRKKRKNKGKGNGRGGKNDRCFKAGESCSFDDQCCSKTTNRICDVPHGASNSDKACCGGQGAICGGVDDNGDAIGPFCCVGEAGVRSFVCSQNDPQSPFVKGTCIPAPEE